MRIDDDQYEDDEAEYDDAEILAFLQQMGEGEAGTAPDVRDIEIFQAIYVAHFGERWEP